MSKKLNAKNLQYERSLPPFLARLQGQVTASAGDGPDPLLVGHRRPAKPRSASQEAEERPTIVDGDGNVVGDAEVGTDGSVQIKVKDEADEATKGNNDDLPVEKEASSVNARKKRKAGRVVGGDSADDANVKGSKEPAEKGTNVKRVRDTGRAADDAAPKPKKLTAKKVKLSFGDDEG